MRSRAFPVPRIDGWELLKSVRSADRTSIEALLALLHPLAAEGSQARYFLIEGADLQARFLGVQLLATDLRNQGDVITCGEVASELFRALEHDPAFVHGGQAERHMANNVLDLLVFALSHSGRHRQLILEYPRWLAMAEHTAIDPYFASRLRLGLAEALGHAGEYERAINMLEEARAHALGPSEDIEARQLALKLQHFYGRVDEAVPAPPPTAEMQQQMLGALGALIGEQAGEPARLLQAAADALARGQAGALDGGGDLTTLLGAPITAQGLNAIEKLNRLTPDLWSQRSPLPSLMKCMALVQEVLTHDQGRDKAVLGGLVASLEELIAYAGALDFWDDRARAKWAWCIALKRLQDFEAAAVAHRDLRRDIEERRAFIEDPLMRARLGGYFRYLYCSNAETLFRLGTGQEEELFHVVESAKWRVLAESAGARPFLSVRRAAHAELAALEARALGDLRQALPAVGAPVLYVSYLADDEWTYALTVGASGQASSRRIPLGAAALTEAALELQRINDGDPHTFRAKFNARRPEESSYEPVIRALSPLVDWLELDGIELLCLNLPHEVSTVPAHMLRWRGKSLIDCVGVVHAPGAELLSAGARDGALYGPLAEASVFSVPRAGSRGVDEGRAFARITTAIGGRISTLHTAEAQRVDRRLLAESDLRHRLVHFSAHGHFDRVAPLKRSGLFIADGGELPSTAEQERFLLTAEDAAGLQIAGSHVTLSACVSGRSAQIAPGEALGMIWAFLRGRARSVLGACWSADREATADLMVRFYELWLGGSHKWRALREAMLEMKADKAYSHPYFWAPFVLYGHWD